MYEEGQHLMERIPCIICYRLTSDTVGQLQPQYEDQRQALTRFFQFLARHLDDSYKTDDQYGYGFESTQFPIEKIIHAGLLACADCSGIINSFCELYHQMKSTELLLNWKVRTLKNIMICAQRVPARVAEFRTCVEKLDIGDIAADEVFEFKKELGKKCDGILQTSLPRLKLYKYRTENDTETNPNLLVDGTARSQTPCSTLCVPDKEDTAKVDNLLTDPINMDLDGLQDEHFPIKSTMSNGTALLLSTEVVQVKEDRSQRTNGNTISPQTTHEPEFEINDVKPGHIRIRSIRKRACKAKNQKVFVDNFPNCTPPGTGELIPESSYKEYSVPPPPIIIPSKDSNVHRKLDIEKELGTGMYVCRICLNKFKSRQSARFHFESRHLNMRFKCSVNSCGKVFTARPNYYHHFPRAHINIRVNCDVCQKIFYSATSLRRHHIYAHAKGRFQCQFCLKSFAFSVGRFVHMKRHCPNPSSRSAKATHPRDRISLPSEANKQARFVSGAFEKTDTVTTVPMAGVHQKKNMCPFCKANFVYRSTLSTHKLICPKKPTTESTTRQKQDSKRSGKHVYRCSNCSKVFTQNGHLKRHFMTVHLQLREFQCELCNGKFNRKDSLNLHRRRFHTKLNLMKQNHDELELD